MNDTRNMLILALLQTPTKCPQSHPAPSSSSRSRAPPPARGATAGSRSLLTRLSSAKTSVILYDKKMGRRRPRHRARRSPLQTNLSHGANALAHLGRPQARPRPPTGRTSDRAKSKQRSKNNGKGHSRVPSRLEPLRSPSPLRTPGHHRVGAGWAREGSRHSPFRAGQSVQRGKCDRLFSSS